MCTKLSRPGRRPVGLSREFLTGKCKGGVHRGVSRDVVPSRNSAAVPSYASIKLGKPKVSWNLTWQWM